MKAFLQPARGFLHKHEAALFSAIGLAALFLILVAALMLRQQAAIQTPPNTIHSTFRTRLTGDIGSSRTADTRVKKVGRPGLR